MYKLSQFSKCHRRPDQETAWPVSQRPPPPLLSPPGCPLVPTAAVVLPPNPVDWFLSRHVYHTQPPSIHVCVDRSLVLCFVLFFNSFYIFNEITSPCNTKFFLWSERGLDIRFSVVLTVHSCVISESTEVTDLSRGIFNTNHPPKFALGPKEKKAKRANQTHFAGKISHQPSSWPPALGNSPPPRMCVRKTNKELGSVSHPQGFCICLWRGYINTSYVKVTSPATSPSQNPPQEPRNWEACPVCRDSPNRHRFWLPGF